MREPLSAEGFTKALADHFSMDDTSITLDSRLIEDLALDSLELYEVVLLLEDVADCDVPAGLIDALETVGDVFHHYCLYSGRAD